MEARPELMYRKGYLNLGLFILLIYKRKAERLWMQKNWSDRF